MRFELKKHKSISLSEVLEILFPEKMKRLRINSEDIDEDSENEVIIENSENQAL